MDSKEKVMQLSEFMKELVGLLRGTFDSPISAAEVGVLLKKLQFVMEDTPIEKLLGCELTGCHELNYFKLVYTQLDDDILVTKKDEEDEKVKVKVRNIHSMKHYDRDSTGFKQTMVRMINGEEYILCNDNLSTIQRKYPVAFITYSRWELLCLTATSEIHITDKEAYVRMHGWGNELYTFSSEKLKVLQGAKKQYDRYLNN